MGIDITQLGPYARKQILQKIREDEIAKLNAKENSKYHSEKVEYEGEIFDSQKELDRWLQLKLLERTGRITELKKQVPFELIPAQFEESAEVYTRGQNKGQLKQGKCIEHSVKYVADFVYFENGKQVVEDAKGVRTKEYIIKRKLMLYIHGIRIKEV